MRSSLKAFTLLEVLIVVSIFALISSFVYPTVSRVVFNFREKLELKERLALKELKAFCIFLGGKDRCLLAK